mmetsp:Transcript_27719/g.81559  ORF Transcript_27719/g.81559 Transcript_27719/m.81559 type:complete len:200 (+) Transcript_27719:44-643(+)
MGGPPPLTHFGTLSLTMPCRVRGARRGAPLALPVRRCAGSRDPVEKPFCLAPPGASLYGAIPRVPPKLSQYRGSEGSTSFAQRTMPPSSEYKRAGSRPSSTSDSHAAAERTPALQCTRMSRSRGRVSTMPAICRCGCCASTRGRETTSASRAVRTSSTNGSQPPCIRSFASCGVMRAKRSAARAAACASSAAAWPQKPV